MIYEFGPCVGDRERYPQRVGYPGRTEEDLGIAEVPAPLRKAFPQSPGAPARPWARHFGHRPRGKISRLRSGGHEHEVLRRDFNRRRGAVPFIVEPIDGDAGGSRREADVPHKGVGEEVHAAWAQPRDQRFYKKLVLIDGRPHHAPHV